MYPTITEYKDAIRQSSVTFRTMAALEPVYQPDGELTFSSGNFAVVFKMRNTAAGNFKAIKCFTREVEGRRERQRAIAEYLNGIQSSYLVHFEWLDEELWVESDQTEQREFPVVVMDWVEGETLGALVAHLCRNNQKTELETLATHFDQMAKRLLEQPFAHGDLKHDNIIIRPDGSLVLVDYDGMFVPSLTGQQALETGSPAYRHPKRTEQMFDEYLDDFSMLVVSLSLWTLKEIPDWHSVYNTQENLLISPGDLELHSESALFNDLRNQINKEELLAREAMLELALALKPGKINGLEAILSRSYKITKTYSQSNGNGVQLVTKPNESSA